MSFIPFEKFCLQTPKEVQKLFKKLTPVSCVYPKDMASWLKLANEYAISLGLAFIIYGNVGASIDVPFLKKFMMEVGLQKINDLFVKNKSKGFVYLVVLTGGHYCLPIKSFAKKEQAILYAEKNNKAISKMEYCTLTCIPIFKKVPDEINYGLTSLWRLLVGDMGAIEEFKQEVIFRILEIPFEE